MYRMLHDYKHDFETRFGFFFFFFFQCLNEPDILRPVAYKEFDSGKSF